ncbi:hypothetical protein DPMN_112755 [Dreissena polymorpha]|uniref:Uncharacterized protein n=1 Tax=Dreissena polymorpha TaxID=45954 RepID=A0A9D4QQY2_DREPO|nr:hypothetical protein DPMN_112755 [Dreissena polymorpha]
MINRWPEGRQIQTLLSDIILLIWLFVIPLEKGTRLSVTECRACKELTLPPSGNIVTLEQQSGS